MLIDRDKPTVPTGVVKQIVGTDDAELQRWVSSGKLDIAEAEPGKGRSRMFTANQVIGFALTKHLTKLGMPIGVAKLAVSSIDLTIQGAEVSAAMGAVNAPIHDQVRYVVITQASANSQDWNAGDCIIVADTFERAVRALETRRAAIFVNVDAIQSAVLSRLSPLS